MPFSTSVNGQILDHFFDKAAWPDTTDNRWIGLSSTTPTASGSNVTEPSTGGYARQQLTAAMMNAASGSATENNTAVEFPQASADWLSGANLTHMVMYTLVTAGTFLAFKSLDVAKPVLSGDTAVFEAGDLDFTMGGTA